MGSIPALVVERATYPDERRIKGTIQSPPAKVAATAVSGPCLILIGAVFALCEENEVASREPRRSQLSTSSDLMANSGEY
jgi:siroheme synthase